MNKLIANTFISLSLAVAAAAATAQIAPAAPGAHPMQGARMHDGRLPSERVEARLAHVKTALRITVPQEVLWNAFADTLRRQAAERDQWVLAMRERIAQGQQMQKPDAITRIERQQQRLVAAHARLGERLAVQKPLYEALSAEQRAVADELLALRGRHPGMRAQG